MNYDKLRAYIAEHGHDPPAPPPLPPGPAEEFPILELQTRTCTLLYATQTKSLKVAIERAIADKVSLRHLSARISFNTRLRVEGASKSLAGINLAGQDLFGADFRECSLMGANFRAANLASTNFWKSDVSGADFTCATIHYCLFDQAKLDGANFGGIACEPDFHEFLVERKLIARTKDEFYTDTSRWKRYDEE